jgi:hypothetical protein
MVLRQVKRLTSSEFRHAEFQEKAAMIRRGIAALELPERTISRLAKVAPRPAALIDWQDPAKLASWGGPMNGQSGRQQLVRQLVAMVDPAAVVETGTYRATTTEFLAHVTGGPVYTVESERRFFEYARRRCSHNRSIQLSLGDSRGFLGRLAADPQVPKKTVLFYLDAHWDTDLPLAEELTVITEHWTDPVVVIDDFAVPGDPGYGFDDYGPGRALTLDYLPQAAMGGMTALFPALRSTLESGARRGCVVLASLDRAAALLSALPLRRAHR